MLQDGGVIEKLTKREATLSDIDEAPISKSQRKTATRGRALERDAYNERVIPLTRLLDGKEICVINGADETSDDLTKERIERTLRQHSAKIVQNPMNNTFCVIVGNDKTVGINDLADNSRIMALHHVDSHTRLSHWEIRDAMLCFLFLFSRYEQGK